MYHKIVHENTLTYLKELPSLVFQLLHTIDDDYFNDRWQNIKLKRTGNYFSPSTTTLWNNLQNNIQRTKRVDQKEHFLSKNKSFDFLLRR